MAEGRLRICEQGYKLWRTGLAPWGLNSLFEVALHLPPPEHAPPSRSGVREGCRVTSLIRNSPPPEDHHRTLGIVLL